MNSRKSVAAIMFMLISVLIVTGCGSSRAELEEGKINVMTSFYPLYDFTQKIGGEHVNVINLVPTGVDPHDWAPKPQDMANIINADVFVYNGLGFEGWVDSFLGGLKADSKLIIVEASQGIEAIAGSHSHADHEDHSDYDPHVWLSPLQAKKLAENIKSALIQVDAAKKAEFEMNYEALIGQLDELHDQYLDVATNSPRQSIVVSHEAYGYLVRDYGLQQVGIMGLSSSAEPTVQTMKQITNFINDNEIDYILFEELASPKIAQTLADDTGVDILVFNTLEGLTDDQLAEGKDYISIMKNNLTSLEKALQ